MRFQLNPRRLLPIVVGLAIATMAARGLLRVLHHLTVGEVLRDMHAIANSSLALAAVLVVVLYSALAVYEVIVARVLAGPVSDRRAMLGALLAAPIGHFVGWGAVSGGAIRYRLYRAVLMRPLDIGKFVLLAAIPYPLGLSVLLALSLTLQSEAAGPILHVTPPLARGVGLALLALHLLYISLVVNRRGPLSIGGVPVTLPPPPMTLVQYVVGLVEVACGASVLYLLLPVGLAPPFLVFVGVYVLCIMVGLASSVPAGFGVFEWVLVTLLPAAPQSQLIATVIAYRVLLEFAPLAIAVTLLVAYEAWWRLPAQRARRARLAEQHRTPPPG